MAEHRCRLGPGVRGHPAPAADRHEAFRAGCRPPHGGGAERPALPGPHRRYAAAAAVRNRSGNIRKPGRNPAEIRQVPGRLLSKGPAEARQASGKNTTRHQQNPGKNAAEERQPPSRPQPRRAAQKRGRQPDALPSPRSPVGTKLRETPPEQRRARTIRQTGGRGRSKPYRENRPATRNDPESGSQNRLGKPIIA